MPTIVRVGPGDLDEVVAFLAREQNRAERAIAYLGELPGAIAAELLDLDAGWSSAGHAVRLGASNSIVGLAFADWDVDLGRMWVHGPWVDGEDADWDRWAGALVDAVIGDAPAAVDDIEMSGTIENVRLGAFAHTRGFDRSEPNYVLELALDAAPPRTHDADITDATVADVAWITPLHESEFPSTYASPQQLLDGNYILLVAPGGYAAGRIAPDGEGYIDFVAVQAGARGAGVGRRLVTALVDRLRQAGAKRRVLLTVQEHREGARQLYAALGFQVEIVIVGYRKKN